MVEWLERLGYGAETCGKVVSSRLGSPCDDWKTLSVHQAENWLPFFRIREGQGSERRGIGSAVHQPCPRYSETLTSNVPTAFRLWETFTFTFNDLIGLWIRHGVSRKKLPDNLKKKFIIIVDLNSGDVRFKIVHL